jgi:putative phosphoesterase
MAVLGVISDTHGLLRPEALAALRGVGRIVHAGDVGAPEILRALEAIAPVTAIRGNVDRGEVARALPATAALEFGGARIYVLHDLGDLDFDPGRAGIDIVISGHTHAPLCKRRGNVLYLNPGSAGPRRFHLPVAVARVALGDGSARAEIVELAAQGTARGSGGGDAPSR